MKSSLAWCSCRSLLCAVALAAVAISCGPAKTEPSRTEAAPAPQAQAATADPELCATPPEGAKGTPQPAVAVASVKSSAAAAPPPAASVEQGRTLFLSYGCAVCHGKEGRGDGVVAPTLNPRPRNFHDPSAYRFGASSAVIAEIIGKGIAASGMPAYSQIPAEEREQIASFVVSLQKKQH